jgi:phage major head subunit gpT-like protein
MALAPANWPDLLEPGLREIFTTAALGRPAPMLDRLFGIRGSTKFEEHYLNTGSFGLVPRFEGSVEYDRLDGGYRTDIENIELAKGFVVQRTLVDDEMYGIIGEFARSMGDSFAITREEDAVDIFNNAFTDGATYRLGDAANGADGVAVCSAAHPNSPVRQGSTQSNEDTLPLTVENWDTSRQRMRAFTDDRGQLIGANADLVARFEPGSAEFNSNLFAGTTVAIWDRLTDATAWFAIDQGLMRRQLVWQERVPLEFAREGDFDGIQQKFRGYVRYGRGHTGWQFIYGNNPA